MRKDKEPQTLFATPAANTAASLLELLDDPTTPEVVRLALVATLRGLASEVARAVADGGSQKKVSEEQMRAHLPRWIATAEREGIRPAPGAMLAFERSE